MRNLWEITLNRSVEKSIFLTWEKMAPSVNQLKDQSALRILYAIDNDNLVGVAPFRRTLRSAGFLRYSMIEPVTNGNTDYAGIIIAGQEKECLYQFLAYLFQQKDWDLFQLPNLPQGSQTLELLRSVSQDLPRFRIRKGVVCPYVTIPDTKEKLIVGLNPKFRRELERRLRKLERERGKVELKNYLQFGSLEEAMGILFRLHQKRWILKGEAGVFHSEEARNMVMETAKLFEEKDWLRLNFLTVNGKPVAANYDLEYAGRMYGHLCGFDPDYSKYSVGNLLLLKVLEMCVEKRISEYDFMQGDDCYKYDWTKKQRQNITVSFSNNKLHSKIVSFFVDAISMSKFRVQVILSNENLANAISSVLQKIRLILKHIDSSL
jgi:hypothetical protein